VEDSGEVGQLDAQQKEERTQRFIEFIEKRKVINLEDLSCEFNCATKDVVKKIETL